MEHAHFVEFDHEGIGLGREERAAAEEMLKVREGRLEVQLEALARRSDKYAEQEALLAADKLTLQASKLSQVLLL
jgi:hypothetical protein